MNRLKHLTYLQQLLEKQGVAPEYWQCIFPKCNYIPANDSGLCHQHVYWFEQDLVMLGPLCVETNCNNLKADGQELCRKHLSIYNMRSFGDSKFNATREITKLCMKELLEKEREIVAERATIALLQIIGEQVLGQAVNLLITKCECCFETFPRNQLIICQNNHGFCVECVERYTESMLTTASVSLKCMNCDGCLDVDDLRMCLQSDTYLKFCLAMDIKEVAELAKILDNYHICPFCASYGCIVDIEENIIIVHPTCKKCNLIWCSGCRRKMHQGNCFTIVDSDTLEQLDKMIQEIITNGLSHKCPKCKTKHFREDGCNHIQCPVCKTHSCYMCGKEMSGTFVYAHYEIVGTTCKMYGESNNIPNLIEELGKFIDNNYEYGTIIYERLKIICKSDRVLLTKIRSLKSLCNIQNTSDSMCSIN